MVIDIFDIIANQKDVRIHIKGEVHEDGLLYDIEYINELINLIIKNENDVEFKKFNIKEKSEPERLTADRFGIYGGHQYRLYKVIEFDIDVWITNKLNKKIDNHLQDFIDYFTVGAIICPNTIVGQGTLSFDFHEEYSSTWVNHDADGDVFAATFSPSELLDEFFSHSLNGSLLD